MKSASSYLIVTHRLLPLLVLAAFIALPINAQPAIPHPDDVHWDGAFYGIGPDQASVFAMAVAPNGDLYVGGNFTQIGGIEANGVARWDGARWWSLGEGVSPLPGHAVSAIAIDSSGSVWVGGDFTTAGGKPIELLARWDGAAWHGVEPGLVGGSVNALVATEKGLYVGGDFQTKYRPGKEYLRCLALLTDTGWVEVGGASGADRRVSAIAVRGEEVWIAGSFSQINTPDGATPAYFVARYDGAMWHAMGDGYLTLVPHSGNELRIINNAPYFIRYKGDTILCGGEFGMIIWTGSRWHQASIPGAVHDAIVIGDTTYFSVADYDYQLQHITNYVLRWTGETFTRAGYPSTISDRVLRLAADRSTIYAGGLFQQAGSAFAPCVARLRGEVWEGLATNVMRGGGATVYDIVIDAGRLYVGGSFGVPEAETEHIAMWDGSGWHALGEGVNGTVFHLAHDGSSLYAAGTFYRAGDVDALKIARWDGARWWPLNDSTQRITSVTAIAVADHGLYIGAYFDNEPERDNYELLRWNGSGWDSITETDHAIYSLLVDGDDLYVAGGFRTIGGVEAAIARWNHGTGVWTPVAREAAFTNSGNYSINALAKVNGVLYAGGNLSRIESTLLENIGMWDGNRWMPVGDGLDSRVIAIVAHQGAIVAGTHIDDDNPEPIAGIAAWDGSRWHSLGSGLRLASTAGLANALAVGDDGALYVGGQFISAGGRPAAGLARWRGPLLEVADDAMIAGVSALELPYPNPMHRFGEVMLHLASKGKVRLTLCDLLGQEVRTLFSQSDLDEGAHAIPIDVSALPEGAYYLLLETSSGRSTRPLRIVR